MLKSAEKPTRIKVIKNIKPSSGIQVQKKPPTGSSPAPLLSENDYNDILNNVLKIRAIEPAPA